MKKYLHDCFEYTVGDLVSPTAVMNDRAEDGWKLVSVHVHKLKPNLAQGGAINMQYDIFWEKEVRGGKTL